VKNVLDAKNKQFNENIQNEIVKSLQELSRIDYFLYIVDKKIITLQNRFEQFKIYEDIFYFLCIYYVKLNTYI